VTQRFDTHSGLRLACARVVARKRPDVNTRAGGSVETVCGHGQQKVARWLLVAGLAGASACVDVNGGAVELSWSIRTENGDSSSCGNANIARVELCGRDLSMPGDLDAGSASCAVRDSWACGDQHGTTAFDIKPGRYELSITPICPSPDDVTMATVPAPIVRDISEGDVAQLNALLIIGNGADGVACLTP
jgi:hypothetical protein